MERFRKLEFNSKLILIVLAAMAVVFAAVYSITTSRVGYLYHDTVFVPRQSGGSTIYEGTLEKQDSAFTVTADSVTLTWGSQTYGPYTLRYDPSAVPEEEDGAAYMTGIEILENGTVYFRGGILEASAGLLLYGEDGTFNFDHLISYAQTSDGTIVGPDGEITDFYRPEPHTIVELLNDPPLQSKGHWGGWFLGLFVSILTAVSILFADELFRFRLSFWVHDVESAEPSDWELTSRRIGWTLMALVVLRFYFLGLQ